MKDLYKILGVDKKSSKDEIKRQYRKKAMENHPDHGGDQEKFNELAISYKILISDEERERYDNGENVFEKKDSNLEIIMPVILDVICRSANVKFYNILVNTKQIIAERKYNECDIMIEQLKNNKEKLIEFNKRIKHDKENVIAQIVKTQEELIDKEIKKLERKKENYENALKFLDEYSYVTDIDQLLSTTGTYFFTSV